MSVYQFFLPTKSGELQSLKDFEGKVLIIVNTASKCGFTHQYEALEALYKQYKEEGLEIIAVPSNQFGEEEPGSNSEIQSFCKLNYGVTFTVMGKADVRDESALDLFKYMIREHPFQGFPPSDKTEMLTDYLNGIDPNYLNDDEVKWNFTKFVVDRKGNVVGRFEPVVSPEEMEAFIKELLV
ncbi:glutathione peroxidase [uncultured Veillonella sp.]|uniref:glutathione peroxidase n=1 Tax=uncultured Veillonella sp. TaxID=159268 RepID=UPI002620C9E3|nr:redoxin domain-containing protein [uncultured Veillonella sp.]